MTVRLSALTAAPKVGVILGSGLGAFADELNAAESIPYAEIADLPQSTAPGHAGKLVAGLLGQLPVAVMSGRAHLYEGYSAREVTAGVRLLHSLGVRTLVVTNAAGGIHETFMPGDLVLIRDHINLQGENPLTGPRASFPDMTEAYSARFRGLAREAAREAGIPMSEGVYAAVRGPSYETPAEIRYLASIGADLVGMSTVLEVIAARSLGVGVLGVSCVTNKAAGLGSGTLQHEEVLEIGRQSQDRVTRLLKAVLPRIADTEPYG